MSSPPTIETFKGTNWEECNNFIRAIRVAAWKEGKFRDLAWVADFAALHFSHQALLWHTQLPQDIRQDWAKLEVALLTRWTPPKDGDESPIEPTPAAAPSQDHSDRTGVPLQGALKVVIDGYNTDYYLELRDGDSYGLLTTDPNKALRIRCNTLSNTTLLERINGSRHSWLAIRWQTPNPALTNGSTHYGFLVLVDSLSLKAPGREDCPHQLASCTVSANGEVIPFWEVDQTRQIKMSIFSNGVVLCLAADPVAYSREYPDEYEAKIFIKPID